MSKKSQESKWNIETKLVRGGMHRTNYGETSEALFLNSGFCYENAETAESRFNGSAPGFVYSRYSNPTLATLEERLALMEGAEKCIVVASGMAAVFASMMSFLRTGDHVIGHRVLFGSCHYILTQILPRFGVEVTLIDGTNPDAWAPAFRKNTTCVFIETPANPTLEIVDIAMIAKHTRAHGAKLVVDNVFSTPLLQHPLKLGADMVVYSTTKHIEGQGRTLGGAILGSEEFLTNTVLPFHRHTGPAMSAFNAWIILKGLETLTLRIERHVSNAHKIAEFLAGHPSIERVIYPGLKTHPQYAVAQKQMSAGGPLVAFELKGGKEKAFAFMNRLEVIDISNNLGDAKSLITHPATTTHSNIEAAERQKIGISDGMMRLSVGLENIDDLLRDIGDALK